MRRRCRVYWRRAADQYRVIDLIGGFTTRSRDFLDEQQRLLSAEYTHAWLARGSVSAVPEVVKRVNPLHRLAVRCVNAVLRLHSLCHCADGAEHGLAALIELRESITALPPLPLAEDQEA